MALRGASRAGLSVLGGAGSVKDGFKLLSQKEHAEYGVVAAEFQHEVTGAKYVHVDTEDTNNVFVIGFCTPCKADSGIAHILEHTALCGSQNYPIRDPFFKMRTRSLSTFMNAFTYPDATMYPFSTVNGKDFYNLMGVYLDAALFPLLRADDFLQEGHRLELDDKGNFVIKGVVFNEMKGVYGDPSSMFYLNTMNAVYGRDSCYGWAFGGLPKSITDLTHEQLVQFHKEHYSPANCSAATYGDLPVEDNLVKLDEALRRRHEQDSSKRFDRKVLTPKPQGVEFSPKSVESTGPLDPLQDAASSGARVAVAWVLDLPPSDPSTIFSLSILSNLLTSGPNAPMYQALIESGVGAEFTSGTGFSADLKGGYFEVGVQGVQLEEHSTKEVEDLIFKTMEETIAKGFTQERVESVLHQVELAKTHRSASWGLNLLAGMIHNETQGYETHAIFEASKHVKELRQNLEKDPAFLMGLLKEHVVVNPHRLTHTMTADAEFSAKLAEEELREQVPRLSAGADPKAVKEQSEKLQVEMDRKEDMSILPSLQVSDIPEEPLPDPQVEVLQHGKLALLQNVITPTNGVWYFRFSIPIGHLSERELTLLPLMCSVLGGTGAGELNYRDLSQEFKLCSSGLGVSASVSTDPKHPDVSTSFVTVTSYGLERGWERFLELLTKVFTEGRLDSADEEVRVRVKSIITMDATDASNGVVSSGHAYSLKKAASQVDRHARCSELVDGLSQVGFLVDTMSAVTNAETGEAALTETIRDLKALSGKLLAVLPGLKASITTSAPVTPEQMEGFDRFVSALPETDEAPVPGVLEAAAAAPQSPESGRVFIQAPADVGFIAAVQKTDLSYLHEDVAATEVMLRILDTQYLHKEVREKGGAYGSGSVSSVMGVDGLVGMYSYRDPSPERSLETFTKALEWVSVEGNITDTQVSEAKLLVFAGIDAPKSPQHQGLRGFLSSLTRDDVKTKRARLLAVTKEDVRRVAAKLLPATWTLPGQQDGSSFLRSSTAAVAGEKAWDTLSSSTDDWKKWSKFA